MPEGWEALRRQWEYSHAVRRCAELHCSISIDVIGTSDRIRSEAQNNNRPISKETGLF